MDPTHTQSAFRIAVVDDYPVDVYVLQRALQRAQLPCVLEHFVDETEASHYFRQQGIYRDTPRPDLIVLDLHLRHASGADVLQQIRSHPALCRVPVVVWTGHSIPHARLILGEAPVDACVTKTSDPAEAMAIGALIKHMLMTKRSSDQRSQG